MLAKNRKWAGSQEGIQLEWGCSFKSHLESLHTDNFIVGSQGEAVV